MAAARSGNIRPQHPMAFRFDRFGYPGLARALLLAGMIASLSASTYSFIHGQATRERVDAFRKVERAFDKPKSVRPEFRARVGGAALVRLVGTQDRELMRERMALVYAVGFALTGLLYSLIDRRAAPLMLLGTFAALFFCGTAKNTWYPWDMPALFFSALALLLALRRQSLALSAAILIGIAFKETILVWSLLFLFYAGRSWRWRLGYAGTTLVLGLLLRIGIERGFGLPVEHGDFLHKWGDPRRDYRFVDNLTLLLSPSVEWVLFANVGLLLLVFLIPTRDALLRGAKLIIALFYVGLFFAGSISECRIFLEALPASLLLLHGLFAANDSPRGSPASRGG
jgi:hypothetical protein